MEYCRADQNDRLHAGKNGTHVASSRSTPDEQFYDAEDTDIIVDTGILRTSNSAAWSADSGTASGHGFADMLALQSPCTSCESQKSIEHPYEAVLQVASGDVFSATSADNDVHVKTDMDALENLENHDAELDAWRRNSSRIDGEEACMHIVTISGPNSQAQQTDGIVMQASEPGTQSASYHTDAPKTLCRSHIVEGVVPIFSGAPIAVDTNAGDHYEEGSSKYVGQSHVVSIEGAHVRCDHDDWESGVLATNRQHDDVATYTTRPAEQTCAPGSLGRQNEGPFASFDHFDSREDEEGGINLYEVLGSHCTDTMEELCRCYVRTAVQVHPRKNPCNLIVEEKIFQQVAAAWVELSDEQSRWRYNSELSAGRGVIRARGLTHVLRPIDLEEAHQIFTEAARTCAAGSPPIEFMETLSSAQKLVALNPGTDGMPTPQSLVGGLAMSAGLCVGSVAVDAAGHARMSSMMRKGAIMQAISSLGVAGLNAFEQHLVREANSPDAASKIGKAELPSDNATNACAGSDRGADGSPSSGILVQCGNWMDRLGSCMPRPADRARSKASPETPSAQGLIVQDVCGTALGQSAHMQFKAGNHVSITGLRLARSLNGCLAEVVGFNGTRYQVRIIAKGVSPKAHPEMGKVKFVKKENLQLVAAYPAPSPVAADKFL